MIKNAEVRRLHRQGRFRIRLQGIQLGHRRGCRRKADQDRRCSQERAAHDRGQSPTIPLTRHTLRIGTTRWGTRTQGKLTCVGYHRPRSTFSRTSTTTTSLNMSALSSPRTVSTSFSSKSDWYMEVGNGLCAQVVAKGPGRVRGWRRKWKLTTGQVLRKRFLAFNMQGVRKIP